MKGKLFCLTAICAIVSLASPIRDSAAVRGTDFFCAPQDDGIVQVEYLESTGEQYIDTEVKFRLDMRISCVCQNTDPVSAARDRRFFGGCMGWRSYGFSFSENSCMVIGLVISLSLYNTDEIIDFLYANRKVTINGTTYNANPGSITYDNNVPSLTLFAEHRPNDKLLSFLKGRIYSFSIDGVIDLVPVRFRNESGRREGAMFDRLSNTLFRNQGSGAFIIGPDAEVAE